MHACRATSKVQPYWPATHTLGQHYPQSWLPAMEAAHSLLLLLARYRLVKKDDSLALPLASFDKAAMRDFSLLCAAFS
jgi:hypothetical protein